MAETSMPWDGTTVGDATTAPYDAPNEFAQIMRALSYTSGVPNRGGVMRTLNRLLGTGAATPVQIDTGQALCQGTFYENSAAVTVAIPPSIVSRIDRIVLRKDPVAQTIRITRVAGVEAAGIPPALTQVSGGVWDTPLCQVSLAIAVITLIDEREFLPWQTPLIVGRQGGDPVDWSVTGNTNYTPAGTKIQCGSKWINPAGGTVITFPEAFSGHPLVVCTAETPGYFASCVTSSPTQAVVRVWSIATGLETIGFVSWIAIGPE
jgi:hypothetical protein